MGMEVALLEGIRSGLVGWYDFAAGSRVLCLGEHREILAAYLRGEGLRAECAEDVDALYDYIVSVADLERTEEPGKLLDAWRGMLKPEGRLLLGLNNRLGLKFFCGDRDPYTGRNFDGIENYRRTYVNKSDRFTGRMYARAEIERMLRGSGFDSFRFYSVLTDLENPAFIFAEDYLPNEDMANRVFPTYNFPDTVFLEEEGIYASLIENGMFHAMANAFFVECSLSGEFSDVLHATCSMERGREDAFFTIIRRSDVVEKRAAYPEGSARLEGMAGNIDALKARGIGVVEGRLEGNSYVMPYVKAEVGQLYLKKLLFEDKNEFLREIDRFRDLILQSSDVIEPDKGDGEGATLARGYWDMVPLNSFFIDGEFVFFDQEFCLAPCPANFVIYRMLGAFYAGNPQFEWIVPMQELLHRYGLNKKLEKWQKMDWKLLSALRKEKALGLYHAKCRRNGEVVHTNRQRVNYSTEEYQRLFVDIFRDSEGKKLVLFGSGRYADSFVTLYGKEHPVAFVVDNNETRQGKELGGLPIRSPQALMEGAKAYKVLICIKDYLSVAKQLDAMGIFDYAIFDPNRDYPNRDYPRREVVVPVRMAGKKADALPKKYRVGYIAGVFDLFHIGHLNMFRRAKEQCEYLIVGVVTDEGVRRNKKVEPFIPFEERIEMVCACRYVDEAVEIPLNYGGTRDAWRMYHFDVQFSGSDYIDDRYWLSEGEFLKKHGAELVFFPYTEQTSSTKIKALINKELDGRQQKTARD